MFRIWFDYHQGMFLVQFYRWGLWLDVRCGPEPREFDTYDEADRWVELVGLRKAFREQTTKSIPYGWWSWGA